MTQKKDDKKRANLKLSPDFHQRFKVYAAKAGEGMNALAEVLLRRALDEYEGAQFDNISTGTVDTFCANLTKRFGDLSDSEQGFVVDCINSYRAGDRIPPYISAAIQHVTEATQTLDIAATSLRVAAKGLPVEASGGSTSDEETRIAELQNEAAERVRQAFRLAKELEKAKPHPRRTRADDDRKASGE